MDKSAYLMARHSDAHGFTSAARHGIDVEVPTCPGWTARDLVVHLGDIYGFWEEVLRTRAQGEAAALGPLQERGRQKRDSAPAWHIQAAAEEVVAWFEKISGDLDDALTEAEPDEPVWTWFPPEQRAGFIQRRMAHETAVHRWDMQAAQGSPKPIEADLARDGIDEMLDVFLSRQHQRSGVAGSGESYHLHQTDGAGEWVVRFEHEGVAVSREHAPADVALRGPASDLLLFLWGRVPADRLDVRGDVDLLPRYFELVAPV